MFPGRPASVFTSGVQRKDRPLENVYSWKATDTKPHGNRSPPGTPMSGRGSGNWTTTRVADDMAEEGPDGEPSRSAVHQVLREATNESRGKRGLPPCRFRLHRTVKWKVSPRGHSSMDSVRVIQGGRGNCERYCGSLLTDCFKGLPMPAATRTPRRDNRPYAVTSKPRLMRNSTLYARLSPDRSTYPQLAPCPIILRTNQSALAATVLPKSPSFPSSRKNPLVERPNPFCIPFFSITTSAVTAAMSTPMVRKG
jgi:hypothetical protein